jgi:hypothetical protein
MALGLPVVHAEVLTGGHDPAGPTASSSRR